MNQPVRFREPAETGVSLLEKTPQRRKGFAGARQPSVGRITDAEFPLERPEVWAFCDDFRG